MATITKSNKKTPDIVYEDDAPGDKWSKWDDNDFQLEISHNHPLYSNIDENELSEDDRLLLEHEAFEQAALEAEEAYDRGEFDDMLKMRPDYIEEERHTIFSTVNAWNRHQNRFVEGVVVHIDQDDKGKYVYTIEPVSHAPEFKSILVYAI